jgi:hypothetical protein
MMLLRIIEEFRVSEGDGLCSLGSIMITETIFIYPMLLPLLDNILIGIGMIISRKELWCMLLFLLCKLYPGMWVLVSMQTWKVLAKSYIVVCYVLTADFADAMPADEDRMPTDGNPHPLPGNLQQTMNNFVIPPHPEFGWNEIPQPEM